MTGTTPRTHGDRVFREHEPMDASLPTLAECFSDAGYQTHAVGKLHVYPQRDRIGFDEVILNEEGRHHLGSTIADDWELYLHDRGYGGQEFLGAGGVNEYHVCPWHLPDDCHPTNWTAKQMSRVIQRRDPRKPGFWYCSFTAPHPPMWPLRQYLDMYRDVEIDPPVTGDWCGEDDLPPALQGHYAGSASAMVGAPAHERELAVRAFYAALTHIDHQIRVVIGTLKEEGLLDNTIIAFTADHGDMLGDHRRWAKTVMYDNSANVPLMIIPAADDERMAIDRHDDRLAELRDVMPTLLDLANLPIPETVEGQSLIRNERRDYLYGEHWENICATRMIRDAQYKLIYYPVGNCLQLFDMNADPREVHNLADQTAMKPVVDRLTSLLITEMYGSDRAWIQDGKLVGIDDLPRPARGMRSLLGQRGLRSI